MWRESRNFFHCFTRVILQLVNCCLLTCTSQLALDLLSGCLLPLFFLLHLASITAHLLLLRNFGQYLVLKFLWACCSPPRSHCKIRLFQEYPVSLLVASRRGIVKHVMNAYVPVVSPLTIKNLQCFAASGYSLVCPNTYNLSSDKNSQ